MQTLITAATFFFSSRAIWVRVTSGIAICGLDTSIVLNVAGGTARAGSALATGGGVGAGLTIGAGAGTGAGVGSGAAGSGAAIVAATCSTWGAGLLSTAATAGVSSAAFTPTLRRGTAAA